VNKIIPQPQEVSNPPVTELAKYPDWRAKWVSFPAEYVNGEYLVQGHVFKKNTPYVFDEGRLFLLRVRLTEPLGNYFSPAAQGEVL
jgi:hypothetical protein